MGSGSWDSNFSGSIPTAGIRSHVQIPLLTLQPQLPVDSAWMVSEHVWLFSCPFSFLEGLESKLNVDFLKVSLKSDQVSAH